MASTRLPGKALLPLAGKPILEHVIDQVRSAGCCSEIVVATSTNPQDEAIVALAKRCGVGSFRGSEEDVLDRYVGLLHERGADACARFCADNIFPDMDTAGRLVALHEATAADYTCVRHFHLPLGLTETVSRAALEAAQREAPPGFRRESITIFIREHPERFRIRTLSADPFLHQSPFRLTLDYPEDFRLMETIFDRLYDGAPIPFRRVLELLTAEPELAALNVHRDQKEGNLYWQQLDAGLPAGV